MHRIVGMFLTHSLALILLGGCAGNGADVVQSLPRGHKVAVLSLVGDSMLVHSAALIGLIDEKHTIHLQDWNIDKRIEEMAAEDLARGGRFTVTAPTTEEIRAWFGTVDPHSWAGRSGVNGGFEALAEYARRQGADSLLLITPYYRSGKTFISGNLNQSHAGYGVYQWITVLDGRKARYYAVLDLTLIDATTGEQRARTQAANSSPVGYGDRIEAGQPISIDHQTRIRTALERLIEVTLADAMTLIALR